MTPEAYTFDDDGRIPNSSLPVLIYHGVLGRDAGAAACEDLFAGLPAGTGHCNAGSSADLVVVGAYPNGMRWDLRRGDPAEHDEVVANIARVPLPDDDPVGGGKLIELWS